MDAASDGSGQERWRAMVAARLPSQHWPQRTVLIVAVDAQSGEPVVFDRHSGVELVDAVAASWASGFTYGIGDSRTHLADSNSEHLFGAHAMDLSLRPAAARAGL